jgi:hypothetical protein
LRFPEGVKPPSVTPLFAFWPAPWSLGEPFVVLLAEVIVMLTVVVDVLV